MKRYTHSAIILLAALSLVGCSKTEEFQNNPDSALQIESVRGISPFAMMQEPASKAVISGETLPSEEAGKGIGLFVTASDGGAYDGKDSGYTNVKYSFNGTKWSAVSPIYLSHSTGKLYGYFPYNETATDLTKIPVASSLNGTDYLYATPKEVSYSNKSVDLTMNHALARLHLTIKMGDTYLSGGNLTRIAIQSKAIDSYGTMDIKTGAVAGLKDEGATGSVVFDGDGVTGIVSKTGIEKDILLVPADNSEGKKDLTLILTIDGVEAKVIFTGDKGLDIRSGVQSSATLVIEDSGIKVTGIGVGLWGDGGGQTVKVGDYTVTVKLSDDVTPHDILTDIYVEGNNVIIKASSFQSKRLICNVGGDAQCERVVTNDKFTFIISEISSDIEAVLGYAPVITLTVTSDSNGKVWIGDDYSKTSGQYELGEQVVIHAAPNENFRFFRWNDNNKESSRTITIGATDVTYSAKFISPDMIPGLFTVDSNGKQVFFSKGNLYYNGTTFNFEANQYDTRPLSDSARVENHISHFMWCADTTNAMALKFKDVWYGFNITFFAAENFTVNGYSGWSVLTGGDNGEWKYLINKDNECGQTIRSGKYMHGVKVCGSANCLILLPDDWKWGENGVGNEWQNEYSESTTIKWSTMEAAGAVCLPAAGNRNGYSGDADVRNVGSYGYYWSASPRSDSNAYDLSFSSDNVNPSAYDARYWVHSVRLVAESKY